MQLSRSGFLNLSDFPRPNYSSVACSGLFGFNARSTKVGHPFEKLIFQFIYIAIVCIHRAQYCLEKCSISRFRSKVDPMQKNERIAFLIVMHASIDGVMHASNMGNNLLEH